LSVIVRIYPKDVVVDGDPTVLPVINRRCAMAGMFHEKAWMKGTTHSMATTSGQLEGREVQVETRSYSLSKFETPPTCDRHALEVPLGRAQTPQVAPKAFFPQIFFFTFAFMLKVSSPIGSSRNLPEEKHNSLDVTSFNLLVQAFSLASRAVMRSIASLDEVGVITALKHRPVGRTIRTPLCQACGTGPHGRRNCWVLAMHQIHKDRPIQAKLYSAISVYLLRNYQDKVDWISSFFWPGF
jgi:hypothetical protein